MFYTTQFNNADRLLKARQDFALPDQISDEEIDLTFHSLDNNLLSSNGSPNFLNIAEDIGREPLMANSPLLTPFRETGDLQTDINNFMTLTDADMAYMSERTGVPNPSISQNFGNSMMSVPTSTNVASSWNDFRARMSPQERTLIDQLNKQNSEVWQNQYPNGLPPEAPYQNMMQKHYMPSTSWKSAINQMANKGLSAERVTDFSEIDNNMGQRKQNISYSYPYVNPTPMELRKRAEDEKRIDHLKTIDPSAFLQASAVTPYRGEKVPEEIYVTGRYIAGVIPSYHLALEHQFSTSPKPDILSGYPKNDRLTAEFNDELDLTGKTKPLFRVTPPINPQTGQLFTTNEYFQTLQNYHNNYKKIHGNPNEYEAVGNEVFGDQSRQFNSNSNISSLLGYKINGVKHGDDLISRRLFLPYPN